jgi:hypothetical protein
MRGVALQRAQKAAIVDNVQISSGALLAAASP